jgi:KDO2-lipid IV(A) lauroyltransferase
MFHVVYALFYLVSLLPLRLLYVVSDVFFVLIYYVIGYRKKVVMENLSIAFPERTESERKRIARQFYRNFTDTFIETIKLVSASEEFIKKHCPAETGILYQLYNQGKKCQVHLGHNFNWELGNLSTPLFSPYLHLGVYQPIGNKIFDRLFYKIRSRTGVQLLPANQMSRAIIPYRNRQHLLALIADQNPSNASKGGYWINFFGRPTPFIKGTERSARTNNAAVVFCHLTKQKRGYYTVHFELVTTEAASLPEGELTGRYIVFLERVIRANPEMWLWSYRRWKHEWKPEYGLLDDKEG